MYFFYALNENRDIYENKNNTRITPNNPTLICKLCQNMKYVYFLYIFSIDIK